MSSYISLTYRPPYGELPEIKEFLTSITTKKLVSYYIGAEKAGKEHVNHYQCWLNVASRIDNYTKMIKKNLKYPDKPALVVETIKSKDTDYVLGYCQKEGNECLTNISSTQLDAGKEAYKTREKVVKKCKKEQGALSIDAIFRLIVEKHKEAKLKSFDENLFKLFIREYSKEIPYSVRAKIRMETFQYHVNIEIEDEMYKVGTNYN